jgi:hypothetical protein
MQIVTVVQGQRAEPVVPEQDACAIQFTQFSQVQGEHVQPVLEAVPDCMQPLVAQNPGIDPRIHPFLLKLSTAA